MSIDRPRVKLALALTILAAMTPAPGLAADPPGFAWKDGDRVVLIGDTMIERDQKYGYLETLITARNPDKAITFRNLGWSGDTVRGLSRAGFGPPADGFKKLKDHVLALQPTVLIVAYGMADSFDGQAGFVAFAIGLNALLDALSSERTRVVLVSPILHEDLGKPWPDPSPHNRDLKSYRDAILKVAVDRGLTFIDLQYDMANFESAVMIHKDRPYLTDDGIHLTELGYRWLATAITPRLGLALQYPGKALVIDPAAPARNPGATKVEATPEGQRFVTSVDALPEPSLTGRYPRTVRVKGLKLGRYVLGSGVERLAEADAKEWDEGVIVEGGPDASQREALRKAINAKNKLYFYRWRPQNETYLFGFRKHEQGNNAREIAEFDPLVAAKEAEIARLKTPVSHAYELTLVAGKP